MYVCVHASHISHMGLAWCFWTTATAPHPDEPARELVLARHEEDIWLQSSSPLDQQCSLPRSSAYHQELRNFGPLAIDMLKTRPRL